jgi:hypothetical protein
MAEARDFGDFDVGNDGVSAKKATISSLEAVQAVDSSLSSSPTPDADAPLTLSEANAIEYTAYHFSNRKKWAVLTVVALCQTSMSK